MIDLDSWQEIWQTISRNKMRSFMTAFGVFWGIFMLVFMVGCGIGLNNGMNKSFSSFAPNSLYLFSGRTSMPYKGFQKGRSWDIRNSDLILLKNQFKEVDLISGVIFGGSSDNNVVRGDKYGTFDVMGYGADYNKIDIQMIVHGRFINNLDILEKRKVCVIGEKIVNDLYTPEENPVGSLLKINGIYYTVIGSTIPATKIQVGGDPSSRISVPITTLQQSLNMGDVLHSIALTAFDDVPISNIEENVKRSVKNAHQIDPEDPQAVNSFNVSNIFNAFKGLSIGISMLIWIVGLGTLFAGVVGISNIMLVTVKERTQEIGIKRALGAKPFKIISHIMYESLLLTAIAGMTGIIAGVGLLGILNYGIESSNNEDVFFQNAQISFTVAVAALIILIVCGLFAGMLPSYRALKIKPIDALRSE